MPQTATELLVHVRDYTKGHPSISANNHPVRHGPVVGIHNGIILNDDELLAPHRLRALGAADDGRLRGDLRPRRSLGQRSQRASSELDGSFATAWLDERVAGTVFVARGAGRPLWIGAGKHELFFASTRAALEVVERYARSSFASVRSRSAPSSPSTTLASSVTRRFRADLAYRDPVALPAVARPQEGCVLPPAPRDPRRVEPWRLLAAS